VRVPVLLAGVLLGVLSRVEERVDGFSLGISSDGTWILVAAAAGTLAVVAPRRIAVAALLGALAGAAVLTAANAGYYALILALEPGTPPEAIAGPPGRWFVLGVSGGAVFGALGAVWRHGPPWPRVAAATVIGAVLIADAFAGGTWANVAGLAAGAALPVASAVDRATRGAALGAVAAICAIAATGSLERFLP
jgi:hypothetical protein